MAKIRCRLASTDKWLEKGGETGRKFRSERKKIRREMGRNRRTKRERSIPETLYQ